MSKYRIQIIEVAEQDLKQIYNYISYHDSPVKAKHVFSKLQEAISKLELMPQRGSYPSELYELGITAYRQIYFKPYRIIYEIDEETKYVFIDIVIDGRRNIQPLLLERLAD